MDEPVGLAEIAAMLGVAPNTVASWRQRGVLPPSKWELRTGPLWLASDVRAWFEKEKGSVKVPPPDRIGESIDLTAEPGRAEVFAHYGLAMGQAQIMEQQLATVLALVNVPEPYSRDDFIAIIERGEKQTLGQLKERLRQSGAPVLGIDHLARVVELRNLLAHHYFRDPERSARMTTEDGRAQLIAELDDATRRFFLTAQHLMAAEVRLAVQQGVSKSDVMRRARQLVDSPRAADTKLSRRASLALQPKGTVDSIGAALSNLDTRD
jgi:hypothetical protein